MSIYNHPSFDGIDKNFITFMDNTLTSVSQSKDPTALVAGIMAISNEAQKYNVNMTPDRQNALMLHLRNNLPPEKRGQFDAFLNVMRSQM